MPRLSIARMLVRPGVRPAVFGSALRKGDKAGSFAGMSALEAILSSSGTSLDKVRCLTLEAFLQESRC